MPFLFQAVPSELVCEGCRVRVLDAVGKMIRVIEEQMSPGVLSALETGRNILDVIGAATSTCIDCRLGADITELLNIALFSVLTGSTLAAVSESASASSSSHPASTIALSALAHTGDLVRSLMLSRVHGEEPLLLSTQYVSTVGFQGDPSNLLCTHQTNRLIQQEIMPSQSSSTDGSKSSHLCQFRIPASLTAHLKSQRSEVVQVLFGMDGALQSNPMLSAAAPPISTSLVAMELTTPQGRPIPIRDLDTEQAIQVALPNKYPVGRQGEGGDGRGGGNRTETCLTVTLPTRGQLNFTVKAVDRLDENAGLYLSFNFSLLPGTVDVLKLLQFYSQFLYLPYMYKHA